MDGESLEAVEIVSGHSSRTHVHDNRGRATSISSRSKAPSTGPSALTGCGKSATMARSLFELAAHGSTKDMLARARESRARGSKRMLND